MTYSLYMTKRTWVLSALLAVAFAFSFVGISHAADTNGDCIDDTTGATVSGCTPVAPSDDVFGVQPLNDNLDLGQQDFRETIAKLINVALSLLGVVAVVIILMGGFQWMTAGGEEEKIEGARKMIFAGVIGMAIILSAFAIARFVLSSLATATGVNGTVPGVTP